MTIKTKFRVALIIAIIFIILSVFIFIMADGLRRLYSGLIFLIMGAGIFATALYQYRNSKEDSQ